MNRAMRAALAAVTAAAALLSGCARPSPAAEPYIPELSPAYEEGCVTPPFWVVSDEETGAQVFLMGSMHAGKEDAKYPEYVLNALRSSSYIAPEMDTAAFVGDIPLQRKCAEYMRLKSGTAEDCIGDEYGAVREFFEQKGIYQDGMDGMIPYYWASAASGLVLEAAGLDSAFGSETILLNMARSEGKQIREIEGGEAQYKVLGDIPMSVQLDLLRECADEESIKLQAESSIELYEAWSGFDSEYISGLSVYDADNTENAGNTEDWQSYYDMMYTDRQELMTRFITDSLQAGERGFVFVGAMHFYAEPSIITLLEQSGYTAKEIRPERSESCESSEKEITPAA